MGGIKIITWGSPGVWFYKFNIIYEQEYLKNFGKKPRKILGKLKHSEMFPKTKSLKVSVSFIFGSGGRLFKL